LNNRLLALTCACQTSTRLRWIKSTRRAAHLCAIEADLESVKRRLARLPTRKEQARLTNIGTELQLAAESAIVDPDQEAVPGSELFEDCFT
jgi:hypothetical protein